MLTADSESAARDRGARQSAYLRERYWERANYIAAPPAWKFKHRFCVSRAGRERQKHTPDKDGRCVFCDWLDPTKARA